MKNIFVEGIQGAGKSTLVNQISKLNPNLHVCREGDYNPIDLAWCALMSQTQYERVLETYKELEAEIRKNTTVEKEEYIVTYTKIHTQIQGFYKEMENHEVYCGRKPWPELKEIILKRFGEFTQTGYLFECAFFQNIVEDLILFHMLSDEEILCFYRELFERVQIRDFQLFYLYSEHPENNIEMIKKERCDDAGKEVWYEMMQEYFAGSPYGKAHGCRDFEDLIKHFKHRQQLEMSIIKEVLGEKAVVLLSKKYDMNQIIPILGISTGSSYTGK